MIIESIRITEGLFSRSIQFSNRANLIHSKRNGRGKTTLLRFLLYSLGYSIPNTKNIKFEQCVVETIICTEKNEKIKLTRTSRNYIVATINDERTTYILPEQQIELQSIIFGTNNTVILENLLGAFYVDQEKGWTLLNRGVAIGSNRFGIEGLVRGLSGCDCTALIEEESKLSRELSKYRQMFSVARYQETIETEGGSLAVEQYEEKLDSELEQLRIKQQSLNKELRRLDRAIKDNRSFSKFIAEMKLLVMSPDGTTIPVTAERIVGFEDSIEYLITKHKIVSAELASVLNSISSHEKQKHSEVEQLSFWQSETMIQAFDRRIASLQINAVAIEKEIKRIDKRRKEVRDTITERTRINNGVVNSLYQTVLKYAKELGIGSDTSLKTSYLFTSNLKELSGAELHKTVFVFQLAYISEIKRAIGVNLPIILDSPSGKEVDEENVKLMMDILKRDFSDHQIIIASIYNYDFDELNVIEIVNRLIELN